MHTIVYVRDALSTSRSMYMKLFLLLCAPAWLWSVGVCAWRKMLPAYVECVCRKVPLCHTQRARQAGQVRSVTEHGVRGCMV